MATFATFPLKVADAATRKFDGRDFRWVSAGKYVQVNGRAGRRGLHERCIVIQMVDEKMDPASAKEMLRGQDDPLNSSSHLGYSMLLQRMLVKGFDSEQLVALPWPRFHSDPVRLPVVPCIACSQTAFLWPACACLETSAGRQGVGDQGLCHQAREARRAIVFPHQAHGQDAR